MTTPMWGRVTLRYQFWEGPKPKAGDGLKTNTGRTYEILKVRGRQLDCLVVPSDSRIEGTTFRWLWISPKKRKGSLV